MQRSRPIKSYLDHIMEVKASARNNAPAQATHYDTMSKMYLRDRFNGRGVDYWNGEEWIDANRPYPPESAVRL